MLRYQNIIKVYVYNSLPDYKYMSNSNKDTNRNLNIIENYNILC